MIANYHTHTFRCGHAALDDERIYIENAIKAGFKHMGFSDHCPMPLPRGVNAGDCTKVLGVRMKLEETEGYVNSLLKFREEYKNDINIHIGFEVEYLPQTFDLLLDFIAEYPIEYLLLGQHFNGLTDDAWWFARETRSEDMLKNYVDLCIEAMKTGKFTYVAHPDLCRYFGYIEVYEREMRRLINCANEQKLPLEINFLGLHELRNYPNVQFWQLANEIGCDVVFGSDAHWPENVCNELALKHAQKMVESYPNLRLIENTKLISPINKQ